MSSYIQFGAGKLFVVPTGGNLPINPTPQQVLTIQDVSIDISGEIKELKGASQFPDDTAVADKKGSGKFSMGRKDLQLFNQMFSADTTVTGGTSVSPNEQHVPTTNAVTVTPPSSGTFADDLGVFYQSSGLALVRVAASPAVGQYSVAAGVYTFAAGDTAAAAGVVISYSYTLTGGTTYQINNQPLGYGPQCELYLVDTYQPKNVGTVSAPVLEYNVIHLFAAKINKITLGNKRADYSMPEVDFSYFQNAAGKVIEMYSVN